MISKTLHSTCQAFERETSNSVAIQPRFIFVHIGNREVQGEWCGGLHLLSTMQP